MNRLKELRQEKGISLTKLSEILAERYGISVSTSQLMYYEKEKSEPRNKQLWKKLADYFGVSEAYLLGYSSVKTEADLKVAVLDETLKKLHVIKDNMILRESDEDPNLLELGLGTAIVAIESFKREIEAQKDEQTKRIKKRKRYVPESLSG